MWPFKKKDKKPKDARDPCDCCPNGKYNGDFQVCKVLAWEQNLETIELIRKNFEDAAKKKDIK